MNEFKNTYNLFYSALASMELNYDTYTEWMQIPKTLKAAALYLRFYREITIAWNKCKRPFIEEENAVSTLMQYLMKNVPVLESYPKRFHEAYMYKVAFNTFYPLTRIKRDIQYYENRGTSYQYVQQILDTDLDYDNICYQDITYITFIVDNRHPESEMFKHSIWNQIEKFDYDTQCLIEEIINGSLKKNGYRKTCIIKKLRSLLSDYSDIF